MLEPVCSDHKPLHACSNFVHEYNSAILRTMLGFKNADFDLFRNILSSTNWDFIDVLVWNDINHITDLFTEKFMEAPKYIFLTNSVMSGVKTLSHGCKTKLENKHANVDEYIYWLSK